MKKCGLCDYPLKLYSKCCLQIPNLHLVIIMIMCKVNHAYRYKIGILYDLFSCSFLSIGLVAASLGASGAAYT